MSVHHMHHIEDPQATTPPPQFAVLGSVPTPPLPERSEAMTVLITMPPGSAGTPPHRHTGPAFGYVIEGEMIFYQDGNNLADATTRFVVTMFCASGQPMLIPVSVEELEERRSRRAARP